MSLQCNLSLMRSADEWMMSGGPLSLGETSRICCYGTSVVYGKEAACAL